MPMHQLFRLFLFLSLLAPLASQAVTLGEARVRSYLNQPLNAEIDLIGLAAGQHEDLRLRIANDRHFERLGISYTQFLNALTFDVAQSDGRWIVRARSTRPVTEPFLDFPLQMTWPGGQLIKQYTLLLDPPRRVQPARAARTSRATPASKPAASRISADTGSYGPVRSGETLWPIAKKLKPRGITTRQMAMALLRANPQAFIDGNVNKLRAGSTLTIPQRAFIEQLDAATARAQFSAQTRAWQAPVATSPRPVEAPVTRTPVLQPKPDVAAKEEEKTPASKPEEKAPVSEAQLRIVTADKKMPDVPAGSQQDLQKQLLVTMEEIESNRITTEGIESRLARMEAELTRMQKLVELKDAQIAALQSDAAAREAIQAAAQTAEPPAPPAVSSGVKTAAKTPADKATAPISIKQTEPLPTDTTPKGDASLVRRISLGDLADTWPLGPGRPAHVDTPAAGSRRRCVHSRIAQRGRRWRCGRACAGAGTAGRKPPPSRRGLPPTGRTRVDGKCRRDRRGTARTGGLDDGQACRRRNRRRGQRFSFE